MSDAIALVWFRLDLRLLDNPALDAAVRVGGNILPVFIWAPEEEAQWAPGAASRWWLHQSLSSLDGQLRRRGSRLIVRRGPTLQTLRDLVEKTGAEAVFFNRRYEPALIARDTAIERELPTQSFNSALLFEPGEIWNAAGKPFRVFTAFWKAYSVRAEQIGAPGDSPSQIPAPARWPTSLTLTALELEPKINWSTGLRNAWTPGEESARRVLKRFARAVVREYPELRDRPDVRGTSRLSPHLHFGEVGPRQVWWALRDHPSQGAGTCLRQLVWREFAHHLLFHFPHTTDDPLRPEFAKFPWRRDAKLLQAWQQGRTGFPLVDAGMRELWQTGWMHNRLRMMVASFLVKDLLLPWQQGARWFWDTLVDADLANNTLGWQWVAGCGADAAPYFRVFNPETQRAKFDPRDDYVRRWVPELGRPGSPQPIVDHAVARARALEAFASLRRGNDNVSGPPKVQS
jgi:deoxyribodipyrimidine photo-lyase